MLDGCRDQVAFAALGLGKGHAAQSQVVALGPATGKNDLPWFAAQDPGHHSARLIHRFGCLAPLVVDAGGIAIGLGPIGQHGLDDPGIDGRRGCVVEIDGPSCTHSCSLPFTFLQIGQGHPIQRLDHSLVDGRPHRTRGAGGASLA